MKQIAYLGTKTETKSRLYEKFRGSRFEGDEGVMREAVSRLPTFSLGTLDIYFWQTGGEFMDGCE